MLMAANYDLPSVVEKRVRFFDGQFLQEQDFVDEQKYHLDRERRHLRLLHVAGIADGLAVAAKGANQVTVAPGTAIDSDGRQLALAQTVTVDLPAETFNDKQGIELYLSYRESEEDEQTTKGISDFTRWLERPELVAIAPGEAYAGATPPVLLARVALDSAGRVTVDDTVRAYSGLRLPGQAADPPTLRTTPNGEVSLAGALTVTGLYVRAGKLRLDSDQQIVFPDGDMTNNLKLQLWTGYGLGINSGTLFYTARVNHSWRDHFGENERMLLTTDEGGGLTVRGTGTSSFAGPLQLRRAASTDVSGAWQALELYQDEWSPRKMSDVYPGIRFRHHNHFETTLEARKNAFHLLANAKRDGYADLSCGTLASTSVSVGAFGSESPAVGTETARALVDIQHAKRGGTHPASVPGLYVTADLGEASKGIEFRHSDATQGIGFGSNSLYAAGSNANQNLNLIPKGTGGVGIGTTTPKALLHVNGDVLLEGGRKLDSNGRLHITGDERLYLLNKDGVIVSKAWKGTGNLTTEGDLTTRRVVLKAEKRTGEDGAFSTIACNGRLHITGDEILWLLNKNGVIVSKNWGGNGDLTVEGTFHNLSDARLKKRIRRLERPLDRLTGVRGVSYLPRQVGGRDGQSEERPAIGVLAQEVEAVFPQLVSTIEGHGYKAVNYNGLTAVLLEAVKELKTALDALQARVATLEAHA
jgi:Chaperone of endosialidase